MPSLAAEYLDIGKNSVTLYLCPVSRLFNRYKKSGVLLIWKIILLSIYFDLYAYLMESLRYVDISRSGDSVCLDII